MTIQLLAHDSTMMSDDVACLYF